MALIQVKPIEIKKWHDKKGQESFARPKIIQALVDPNSVTYQTGLSPEEEKKYGELLKVDLSSQYNMESPHPFWDSKMGEVKLENRTMIFDTENPIDFIKIKICKASKYVANSLKEYEEGKFPFATHVIFDEREEVQIKASKISIKKEAIIESAKLSRVKKVELIRIIANKSVRNQSDEWVEVELDKILEAQPEKVLNMIKADKAETTIHAMILEGLEKNVLRKEGTSIYYFDDQLGYDIQSTINYFKDPSNQKLKAEIIEKLK